VNTGLWLGRAILALILSFVLGAANAADVKLLSSAAFKPALEVLGPQFERATGNKLMATFVLTPEVPKLVDGGRFLTSRLPIRRTSRR
jgi:hypothetical protein